MLLLRRKHHGNDCEVSLGARPRTQLGNKNAALRGGVFVFDQPREITLAVELVLSAAAELLDKPGAHHWQ